MLGCHLLYNLQKKKNDVIGFDIDLKKISALKKEKSYIKHIPNKLIQINKNKITFQNNFKQITNVDIIILCLPTPLTKNYKPDLSYINKTLQKIKNYLSKGQIIILESSTYPGSTREFITPHLKNFIIGKNFF